MESNQMLWLPPATKLRQGYVFTRVCDSVHRGGGIPACLVAGLGGGDGIPACLAGLQAHTQGGSWGVCLGGSPGPHPGGKFRGLAWGEGGLQAHTQGGIPACTEAETPKWLLLWALCILLECILVTACKRSLGQGNIFIGVCQEFCSQGGHA